MFECKADLRNTIYLNNVLTGEAKKEKAKYFTIFSGLPSTGKSESARAFAETRPEKDVGVFIVSDKVKKEIEEELRTLPHEFVDMKVLREDQIFPKQFRDFCYERYIDRVVSAFRRGESATLDATVNTKEYWSMIFDAVNSHPDLEGVYIVMTTAKDEDVRKRLNSRKLKQETYIVGGMNQSSFMLTEYGVYSQMKAEQKGYSPFDDLKNMKDKDKIHLIFYDTSGQTMSFYNKDHRLEEIAISVKQHIKKAFEKDVKFI
jgi:predicted kinase